MKLSKKAEYALRAMTELVTAGGDGPVRIAQISRNEKIPRKFLERILNDLKKGGILKSVRGARGGYILAKEPADITFADVVRLMDGPLAPLRCVSKYAHVKCSREKICLLKNVMMEVRNAVAGVLETRTFADVAEVKRRKK
ncbi:MAG: Rrf2 family transcriptional regulator [Candidatus Omnitrophica bacterium]|nr:Rrf2 family transcriptional regulator [Candidatus Omnitrophota bacterium]